jgi:hypothetical protein
MVSQAAIGSVFRRKQPLMALVLKSKYRDTRYKLKRCNG